MNVAADVIKVVNVVNATIRGVAAGLDVAVDASNFVIWWNQNEQVHQGLRIASIVSRTALVACSIIDIIRHASGGFSSNATHAFKTTELFVRLADLPIQFTKTAINSKGLTSAQHVIRVLEKGIVGPLAGILSTATVLTEQTERDYFELYQKDPNAKRPIYHTDADGNSTIIGFEKIDPDKCQQTIANCQKAIPIIETIGNLAELSTLESAYRALAMRQVVNQQQAVNPPPPPPPPPPQQQPSNQFNGDLINIDQMFDFRSLNSIPVEFHDDEVFKKYICPITLCPIRYPVQDPTARPAQTFYERDAIAIHLVNHSTSPITRRPLNAAQLLPCPHIQWEIDQRLDFHSRAVRAFIQDQLEQEDEDLQESDDRIETSSQENSDPEVSSENETSSSGSEDQEEVSSENEN